MSRLRWPDSTNSVSEKPGTIHRAENCHYHHGDSDFTHPFKMDLKNVFCPPSGEWRAGVLEDGLKVFLAARQVALPR